LGGIRIFDWIKLLREIHFGISPACLPRALSMTSQSIQNSLFAILDRGNMGQSWANIEISPPLFVIGHWRSGTTHLHNLLALDTRFAFPNNYQALFPHSFLTAESMHSRAVEFFLPKRRPMDNIEWNMRSAQEDEFALCITTFLSPYMGWVLPRQKERYEKYLTFHDASPSEIDAWKAALVAYLKKLTWKHRRPLVLKSPPHTARIRLLLDLFPNAKFIHIHRDPLTVFVSTRKMLRGNATMHCLQRGGWDDIDEYVLRLYRVMHDAFFEDRSLIPPGNYHELSFTALESDPLGQMRTAFEKLSLPEFAFAEPTMKEYLDSIAGYEKNVYTDLPIELKARIKREWRRCFDEWGYQER
jgi:omega-hydroxy-beta-dihydromenaquinone-9 sulfotransferase